MTSIHWAKTYFWANDYSPISDPEIVVSTLWSNVWRFMTANGLVYLKETPKALALEAPIIQLLRHQFHTPVPEIITYNPTLNCFLMKEAGVSLRAIFNQECDFNLMHRAIDAWVNLQSVVTDQFNVFFNLGVPDWRLTKLTVLYQQLLMQTEILFADGLTVDEINALMQLQTKISSLCDELSLFNIKETIVQPDFNDNNVLYDQASQMITIIDLGEITISHPFFSAINCLEQLKKHYGLKESDDQYVSLLTSFLKPYLKDASSDVFTEKLFHAFAIVQQLWPVYNALANYRLMLACGPEKLIAFQPGRLCTTLQKLLASL